MDGLRQFPLGDTITGNPHSVCVSLPTMADVIGYEEKDPRVLGALQTGYPRFFEHPFVRRLTEVFRQTLEATPAECLLCANRAVAAQLVAFAGAGRLHETGWGKISAVVFDRNDLESGARGRAFLQHMGGRVSSREAEGWLVRTGVLPGAFSERRRETSGETERARVAEAIGVSPRHVSLTRGGMNAFYSAFCAINALPGRARRRRWVQVGWLYVDTIRILAEMSPDDAPPLVWKVAEEVDGLASAVASFADEIAGIVVEAPTNPMFGMPDLRGLRALADRIGALLVVDPSLVGLWNAEVLPAADLVVASLTKYACASGDLMAGVVAINPDRPWASELAPAVATRLVPLEADDLARLGAEIETHAGFVDRVNATTPRIAAFLENHPAVDQVWWARPGPGQPWLRGPGAVLSFTVRGPVERFYDRLEMAKGPSFGTGFSLLSPYVWLAHYDLAKSSAGRAELAAAGVPADVMRLSVGAEEPERIEGALRSALSALG